LKDSALDSAADRAPDMRDAAQRLALYDRIYRAGKSLVHPRKGRLGAYGSHDNRDQPFVDFLLKRAPPPGFPIGPPSVLDASCGCGHLSEALVSAGYKVDATEVSPWLVQDLSHRLPKVDLLAYADLGQLPARSFDVVISNDVLEHLPEREAIAALHALAGLSRRWLLISVGLGRGATKYPEALGLGRLDLHLFTPGARRWVEEIKRVGRIVEERRLPKTLWAFAEVKS
jgi:SAM-dependent methyltransferase